MGTSPRGGGRYKSRPCAYAPCQAQGLRRGGLCNTHFLQQSRGEELRPARKYVKSDHPDGYLTPDGYVRVRVDGKTYQQHRWVMSQILGRELLDSENVHHINGDRADNRPENLELWSTWQPPGQRVEDKVRWAREILATYGSTYPEGV